jgi:hypothetical protein
MSNIVDWGRLYTTGRCKAVGVPWNEDELKALYVEKVPADYVREGCFTYEEYLEREMNRKADETRTGEIYLVRLTKDQLLQVCARQEIEVTPEATVASLREVLQNVGTPTKIPLSWLGSEEIK